MNQASEAVDRNAKMLDETVRRVVMSMPDRTVDTIELRIGLAKALHDGPTTLFHLFKVGRDLATRTAESVVQGPELVDRQIADMVSWCSEDEIGIASTRPLPTPRPRADRGRR